MKHILFELLANILSCLLPFKFDVLMLPSLLENSDSGVALVTVCVSQMAPSLYVVHYI
jgi:hypothetical protein